MRLLYQSPLSGEKIVEFGARSLGRKGSPTQGQCTVIRLDWFVFVSFLFCFV